jgi:hypothetical protein
MSTSSRYTDAAAARTCAGVAGLLDRAVAAAAAAVEDVKTCSTAEQLLPTSCMCAVVRHCSIA